MSEAAHENLVTDELVHVMRALLTGDRETFRAFEARHRGADDARSERALDLLWKATFEIFLHQWLGPEPTRHAVIEHVAAYRHGLPSGEDPGAVVPETIIRGFYGDVEALRSLNPDQLAHLGSMLMHLVVTTNPTGAQLDEILADARERAEELAAYQDSQAGPAGS